MNSVGVGNLGFIHLGRKNSETGAEWGGRCERGDSVL